MGAKHSAKMGGRLSTVRGCANKFNVNQTIQPTKINKLPEKGVAATKFVVFIQDVDTCDDDVVDDVESAVSPRPQPSANKPKKKQRYKHHDPPETAHKTATTKEHETQKPHNHRKPRSNSTSSYDNATDSPGVVDYPTNGGGNSQKVEIMKKCEVCCCSWGENVNAVEEYVADADNVHHHHYHTFGSCDHLDTRVQRIYCYSTPSSPDHIRKRRTVANISFRDSPTKSVICINAKVADVDI